MNIKKLIEQINKMEDFNINDITKGLEGNLNKIQIYLEIIDSKINAITLHSDNEQLRKDITNLNELKDKLLKSVK